MANAFSSHSLFAQLNLSHKLSASLYNDQALGFDLMLESDVWLLGSPTHTEDTVFSGLW